MKNNFILLFLMAISLCIPTTTNADFSGSYVYSPYTFYWESPVGVLTNGSQSFKAFNVTHGFEPPVLNSNMFYEGDSDYRITVNLPNDGSKWIIIGTIETTGNSTYATPYTFTIYKEFTTPGTFNGASIVTSTLAAQNAQLAANAAKTAAESSNSIINNSLTVSAGVVQDASGTVLSEARLAKAKADLAATNAANAKTSADNAKTAADNAKTSADNAATKAGQAVTSITTAESNLTSKLNTVESKLNTVQTNLTNISTLLPPILSDVTGYNSATATTSTSFKVSLDYSNATEYRYKLDSGSWSAWTSLSAHDTNGYLTVPVSGNGAHNLSIEIRNSSTSLTSKGNMTFFKL